MQKKKNFHFQKNYAKSNMKFIYINFVLYVKKKQSFRGENAKVLQETLFSTQHTYHTSLLKEDTQQNL